MQFSRLFICRVRLFIAIIDYIILNYKIKKDNNNKEEEEEEEM